MESEETKDVPAGKRMIACKRDELEPGQMKSVTIGRRHIALVCTEEGSYRAIADSCPHEGARLSGGQVEKMWLSDRLRRYYPSDERSVVVCPWHNFEFDLDTGHSTCEPHRMRLKTYAIRVEGEDIVLYI